MKTHKITKLMIAFGAVVLPLAQATPTFAWGPERPTYTMEKPADHATFNSITNNTVLGDERDFVRIVDKATGGTYSSDVELEPNKDYEVYIYYHNNASETYDDKEHDRVGIAWDVRLASTFPPKLKAGEKGAVSATISADNTVPEKVWDEAYITAKENMTLHYVASSAKIYNSWKTNGSVLPTSLFSEQGTFLGMDELNGMIYGCARFSGHVLYTIRTVAEGDPIPDDVEEPDPDPEPGDEPEEEKPGEGVKPSAPSELPKTGPREIALAVIVVALLVIGFAYWRHSKKTTKQLAGKAKGKKSKK